MISTTIYTFSTLRMFRKATTSRYYQIVFLRSYIKFMVALTFVVCPSKSVTNTRGMMRPYKTRRAWRMIASSMLRDYINMKLKTNPLPHWTITQMRSQFQSK